MLDFLNARCLWVTDWLWRAYGHWVTTDIGALLGYGLLLQVGSLSMVGLLWCTDTLMTSGFLANTGTPGSDWVAVVLWLARLTLVYFTVMTRC